MAKEEDESSSEDEVAVAHYPGRERQAPDCVGHDTGGMTAHVAQVGTTAQAGESVLVRGLPPPPKSVAEALRRDDWPLWRTALEEEQRSMVEHGVWRKKKTPPSARRLGTRVVFEYKAKQAGELQRPKCRLVGLGYR